MNITERRHAEAALRQAQKMEAIGKLTGGIAHDFNNLLAVVGGNLELLRKRLPDDTSRTGTLIENALLATQRGASLVQRMLAFARKQDLNPSSVVLPDVVLSMRELLQRSVGTNIAIETRFPLSLSPAYVDANQLEMVLINLVVNARDAMPAGGTIYIEGQPRSFKAPTEHSTQEFIALIVRDDGIGMSPETLARATEPFFTTKGPGKGTGLGLSMAHGLAEQSGGRLEMSSQPGKGTTVELWLPLGIRTPAAEPASEHADEPHAGPVATLSILVVDDDPLVLANTAELLEDLGHRVIAVSDGEAALAVLRRQEAFDILVTDQMMPGMTGTQLAKIVKEERPNLPVLLVSGYAELVEDGRPLHTLAKPFTQLTLSAAIGDTLGRPNSRVVVPLHNRR